MDLAHEHRLYLLYRHMSGEPFHRAALIKFPDASLYVLRTNRLIQGFGPNVAVYYSQVDTMLGKLAAEEVLAAADVPHRQFHVLETSIAGLCSGAVFDPLRRVALERRELQMIGFMAWAALDPRILPGSLQRPAVESLAETLRNIKSC